MTLDEIVRSDLQREAEKAAKPVDGTNKDARKDFYNSRRWLMSLTSASSMPRAAVPHR